MHYSFSNIFIGHLECDPVETWRCSYSSSENPRDGQFQQNSLRAAVCGLQWTLGEPSQGSLCKSGGLRRRSPEAGLAEQRLTG